MDKLQSMLLGCCLGDASLEYDSKKNCKDLSFNHKHLHKDYLEYKKNYLDDNGLITGKLSKTKTVYRFRVFKSNDKNKELVENMFNLLKDSDGNMKLPDDLSLINKDVLLFWFLDDGSLTTSKIKRKSKYFVDPAITIALKSYSDESILKLIDHIKNTYDIQFKPKRASKGGKIGWISIRVHDEIKKFIDLLKSSEFFKDIPQCMHYKFCMVELPKTYNPSYPEYNMCDCYRTGICTCRNKDFTDCL